METTSSDGARIEPSTPHFQGKTACQTVLGLDCSTPTLDSSDQPRSVSKDSEDNGCHIQRTENDDERTLVDGESSKKRLKRQTSSDNQDSPYEEGSNGVNKHYKRRKEETAETSDNNYDELGGIASRPEGGKQANRGGEESTKRKLACPFYKYDRQAFMSSRTCVGPGWGSVHRVKEHLFRRHMISDTQCSDRPKRFRTQTVPDEGSKSSCGQQPLPTSRGINQAKMNELKSRKTYQNSRGEEGKWDTIYRIIFPDAKEIPSPYYEPEVLVSPDMNQGVLMKELPGIVSERLVAPESRLVELITANAMADPKHPTQFSADSQLEQWIRSEVEAAVQQVLSQRDGPKQPNKERQTPCLNVEWPEEAPKKSMTKEEQAKLAKPGRPRDDPPRPPCIIEDELKPDTQAKFPIPTSSALGHSPKAPTFDGVRQVQMGQESPPVLDWNSLSDENDPNDAPAHTTGGEPWYNIWDSLDNDDALLTGCIYATTDSNLSPDVSRPETGQDQPPSPVLETQPQYPPLEIRGSSQAHAQSIDSMYESIISPSDSNLFDDWNWDSGIRFLDTDLV